MENIVSQEPIDDGKYFFQLHTASGKSKIIQQFILKHKDKSCLILVPSILLMH